MGALRLWRVPGPSAEQANLENICSVADSEVHLATVKSALWDPHLEGNLVVADVEGLHVFDGLASSLMFKEVSQVPVGQRCSSACFDPHHPHQVSTVDDMHLKT